MKRKIAIIDYWPTIPNAETEIAKRLCDSAKELGIEALLINPDGFYAKKPSQKLSYGDVDFVIATHFAHPKRYDAFSYFTLWNPTDFFVHWGYERHSNNILTHDDFLSGSPQSLAENHLKRIAFTKPGKEKNSLPLYPSSSYTIPPCRKNQRTIFYCGINWERGSNSDPTKLLKILSKNSVLSIYGPKKYWRHSSNKGYKGEIPFDGKSIINRISSCGIGLVLFKDEHKRSQIASNRVYEIIAAGAVAICEFNDSIYNMFGDSVLYFDSSQGPESSAKQIMNTYKWILENPENSLTLAKKSQEIYLKKFDMKVTLSNIFNNHSSRKKQLETQYLAKNSKPVTAIFLLWDHDSSTLKNVIDNVKNQRYKNLEIILLLDRGTSTERIKKIENHFSIANIKCIISKADLYVRSHKGRYLYRNPAGKITTELLPTLPEKNLFILIHSQEIIFSDHISSLVRKFEDNEEIKAAYSNISELTEVLNPTDTILSSYNLSYVMFCKDAIDDLHKDFTSILDLYFLQYLILRNKEHIVGTESATALSSHQNYSHPCTIDHGIEYHALEDLFGKIAVHAHQDVCPSATKQSILMALDSLNIKPYFIKILKYAYRSILLKK